MSLLPKKIRDTVVISNGGEIEVESYVSKTYLLDLQNGTLSSLKIDGEDALRQFIRKTIATARFKFPIYSDEYGCELEEVIGHDISLELMQEEIPRVISEALVVDDRIEDVRNFEITRDKGTVKVVFKVISVDGYELHEEVTM